MKSDEYDKAMDGKGAWTPMFSTPDYGRLCLVSGIYDDGKRHVFLARYIAGNPPLWEHDDGHPLWELDDWTFTHWMYSPKDPQPLT